MLKLFPGCIQLHVLTLKHTVIELFINTLLSLRPLKVSSSCHCKSLYPECMYFCEAVLKVLQVLQVDLN